MELRLNFTFSLLFLHCRCPMNSPGVLERFGLYGSYTMIRIHGHARVFLTDQRITGFLRQSLCTAEGQQPRSSGTGGFPMGKSPLPSYTDNYFAEKTRSGITAGSSNRKAVVIEKRLSRPGNRIRFHVRKTWRWLRSPVKTAFSPRAFFRA